MLLAAELAHYLGLVPLLWLGFLLASGHARAAAWWALGGVYGVSWLADSAAHVADPWLVSLAYPVLQALVVMAVLRPPYAGRFGVLLLGALVGALLLGAGSRPDLFVRSLAWGGIVRLVWPAETPLRRALVVTFGLGWSAWFALAVTPTMLAWGIYQMVRVVGTGWFCWAVLEAAPSVRAVRA